MSETRVSQNVFWVRSGQSTTDSLSPDKDQRWPSIHSFSSQGMTKPGIIRYYKTQSQCIRTSTRFCNCDQISEILLDFRTSKRFHKYDQISQCCPNFTILQFGPNFWILTKFLNFSSISKLLPNFRTLTNKTNNFSRFLQELSVANK